MTQLVLLLGIACFFFSPGFESSAADKPKKLTCCQEARANKKECTHNCCITAHKKKESCKRCNPNKEDLEEAKTKNSK